LSFKDIALPLAEKGFRVFPLIPKKKQPVRMESGDHFDAATTDASQILLWDSQEPTANVGLAPDEIFCYMETDDEAALLEACEDLPKELFEGTRVTSGRPNRCYYIFRQTMRTKAAGNITITRKDQDNLLEFKQNRVLVTGPGSIHPKTGGTYVANWKPIFAMHDVLLNRLLELSGKPKSRAEGKSEEVEKETSLLERFLAFFGVANDGDWSNKGKSWYLSVECPWRDEHENQSGGSSTCVVYTEDGGYGFDCKHRCAGKGWREFRAYLEEQKGEKFAFSESSAAELGPEVVFGKVTTATETPYNDDAEERVGASRPRYEHEIWDGTFYGEFAELCSKDNFVPKKFYIETLRTVVGAIVGDKLTCTIDGVSAREYCIKIGYPGSGKGTSDDRVNQLFVERWDGNVRTEAALLWSDKAEIGWRSRGIGAQRISPASAPGLINSISDRKMKKGEVRDPLETWEPMPRVITMSEEVRGLFANFANESTGAGLESVLCELYDRDSFTSTVTKDRESMNGKLMYSLLGGITKDGWDAVFSKVSSVESGFLSRVNIVGTEERRTVAGMRIPNFESLRNRFFPMIEALEKTPKKYDPTDEAMALMNRWFLSFEMAEGIGKARLNIHAWRTSLHLAWLHGHTRIEEEDVAKGIKAAEYLAKMREFYAPPQGETRAANAEDEIRKVMREKIRYPVRSLRRETGSNRYGIAIWDGALSSLCGAGELRVETIRRPSGQKSRTVILLKNKD
jgi:hypothetical protein